MDKMMAETVVWLDGLTEPQVRAYACQRGLSTWKLAQVELLRRELATIIYASLTAEAVE